MKSDIDWKWIDRPLPDEFFAVGQRPSPDEVQKRLSEIPTSLQVLARTIIYLALEHQRRNKQHNAPGTHDCQRFRVMLYGVYKEVKEKLDIDLHLPHYWFTDGVMVEPEWIVRITNGLVKWTCDESVETCGLKDCRFRILGAAVHPTADSRGRGTVNDQP